MKTKIYIIPGLGESCDLLRYKNLARSLENKGYKVIPINPDWYRPLSDNVFPIEEDSIIVGFSFGAILAYLIARKYPCKKVIFASISPIHEFSFESLVKDYMEHMSEDLAIEITKDIKNIKVSLKSLKVSHITLMGELENRTADFIVPKTGHKINTKYIKYISDLI